MWPNCSSSSSPQESTSSHSKSPSVVPAKAGTQRPGIDTMMLTKIVGERVYDFSHVVGGRDQVMGPLALAFGRDNDVYAIVSALGGGRGITKYTVGLYPGEEEMVQRIGESGEGPGQLMWTSGIALDSDYNIYVTDAWTDRDISILRERGRSSARSAHRETAADSSEGRRASLLTRTTTCWSSIPSTTGSRGSPARVATYPSGAALDQSPRPVQFTLGYNDRRRRLHLRRQTT